MSFKTGDPVICKAADTGEEWEGIAQCEGEDDVIVYFPNGSGPCGRFADGFNMKYVRHKPKWERVEGKVRVIHDDGTNCNHSWHIDGYLRCMSLNPQALHFERLVEDEDKNE